MYNKIILIGNTTKDAELRYTPSGTPVASCRIAQTSKVKAQSETKEQTLYIDFVIWGKFGETMAQYLSKGTQILVEGRLEERSWEKDGQKHSKMEVRAENVRLLGGKKGAQTGTGSEAGAAADGTTDLEPF